MPRYLEVEDYKSWARHDLPTVDNPVIEDAILAAEMSLDNACGRKFIVASAPATARLFWARYRSKVVEIDDCTTVTAVTDNGTAVTTYQLEPLNGRSPSGETVPYTSLRRTTGSSWAWSGDEALVSVTATWGWLAIPYQIREACKALTKAHLDGRDIRAGIAGFTPDGFGLSERETRVVKQAIFDYSRLEPMMA